MGCDAYAEKDGKFRLVVRSYDTGKELGVIEVEDLDEEERIAIEITEGRAR